MKVISVKEWMNASFKDKQEFVAKPDIHEAMVKIAAFQKLWIESEKEKEPERILVIEKSLLRTAKAIASDENQSAIKRILSNYPKLKDTIDLYIELAK